nr:hypothetical protein [Tanacetum cinerariifolium]
MCLFGLQSQPLIMPENGGIANLAFQGGSGEGYGSLPTDLGLLKGKDFGGLAIMVPGVKKGLTRQTKIRLTTRLSDMRELQELWEELDVQEQQQSCDDCYWVCGLREMIKTRSGINNGVKPLISILKNPRVSAVKTRRSVSIESTNTVWEITNTDFPTLIKSVWRDDDFEGHDSFVNSLLNAAQHASNDVNSTKVVTCLVMVDMRINYAMDSGVLGVYSDIHAVKGVGQLGKADNTTRNIGCVQVINKDNDDVYNEKVDEQFDSQFVNDGNPSVTSSFASVLNPKPVTSKIHFCTLVNDECLDSFECVLPHDVANMVKGRYDNLLVGFFVEKSLSFPVVQYYVNNVWSKSRLEKLMKNDDGVYLFKFSSKEGMEQVTKVLVWVKMHNVPLLAYSEDGMSLIATQIEAALKASYVVDNKPSPMEDQEEGFVEVKNQKKKGKAGSNQHLQISGIKLSTPKSNFQYRHVSKPGKDMDDASDLGANGPKEVSSSQPTIA